MTAETEMNNQERLAKEATEAGFPCGGWVQDVTRPGVEVFLPEIDTTNGDYKFVTGTVIRVNTNTEFVYSFVLRLEDGTQIVIFHSGSWPCYFREPEMSPLLKSLIDWVEKFSTEPPTKKKDGEELFIKRFDLGEEGRAEARRTARREESVPLIPDTDPELEELLDEEDAIEESERIARAEILARKRPVD